ncbi:MAG: ABC transporter ATP-binding protein [Promethearchaeota archaeon]
MKLIEVKNLDKEFYKGDQSSIKALSDINFSVKKGECFVIIGPNGSGKTTLLRLIGLLDLPTQGQIFYESKDLSKISRKGKVIYRRKFSFVRQKPVVRKTSVFNNIAYGPKIRGTKYKVYNKAVKEMIKFIGLEDIDNKNAKTLSGGEMQRVAIAMNFVINPEVYLLDEVSANLDPMNIKLLDNFIMKIKENKEKTIIMSTHDSLEAIKYADRIAVLNNGKISQIGTPTEIFSSPKDEFTALFVGYENIFSGVAKIDKSSGLTLIKVNNLTITASTPAEGEVKVCIRPESIGIVKKPSKNTSYRNTFDGIIEHIRNLGNICHLVVNCGSEKLLITITEHSRKNLGLGINSQIYLNFKATDVKIL